MASCSSFWLFPERIKSCRYSRIRVRLLFICFLIFFRVEEASSRSSPSSLIAFRNSFSKSGFCCRPSSKLLNRGYFSLPAYWIAIRAACNERLISYNSGGYSNPSALALAKWGSSSCNPDRKPVSPKRNASIASPVSSNQPLISCSWLEGFRLKAMFLPPSK